MVFQNAPPQSGSHRAPVGRRRGACRGRSFSGALRPEPDVRVSSHHGSPVICSVDVVVGDHAWMLSWQGRQTTRVLRRRFAMI